MITIVWGPCLVIASWLIHIAIWRLLPDLRSLRILIWIFCIPILFFLVSNFYFKWVSAASALKIILIAIPSALGYVIAYSAIEIDSPTLFLFRYLLRNPDGVERDRIMQILLSQSSIDRRIEMLVREAGFKSDPETLQLVGQPPKLFRLVWLYRAMVGRRGVKGG